MSTKEKLLALLEENRGRYISGEYIAGQLAISRAAIWKSIRALRAEGCEIDAVQNRGYCLKSGADLLSAAKITELLAAEASRAGEDLSFLRVQTERSVTSTNTVLREQAAGGKEEGTVLAAGNQTAGRGRVGRSFYSPEDTGVYLSVILRPEHWTAEKAVRVTTIAAVAACEAVDALREAAGAENSRADVPESAEKEPVQNTAEEGERAAIKWVNDIFLRGKKVSGILTEASFGMEDGYLEYAVLGIGFNVYAPAGGFPEEIRDVAGCILPERTADGRNRLTAVFLQRFFHYYLREKENGGAAGGQYIQAYRGRCFVIGRPVDVISGGRSRRAVALDVDDDCHLLVEYEDGTRGSLFSGEISVRPVSSGER